jgi:hypothetical protein
MRPSTIWRASDEREGLGQALLKDALLRAAQAADIAGISCPPIHAKDDTER